MVRKDLIKSGFRIILQNPKMIPALLSMDFHKIYCSYWNQKLQYCKKIYETQYANSTNEIIKDVKRINNQILDEQASKHEAYYMPLYLAVRKIKPNCVIETGVHRGVSSLFILQAMEDNAKGKLYSIDLPLAKYDLDEKISTESILPEEKVGICVPKNLKKRWTLILGDSKKELPAILKNEDTIDCFLHDSKHTYEHMMFEFNTVWSKIPKSGIIFSDDTNWNKSFEDFAQQMDCENIQMSRDNKNPGTFGIIVKK